MRSSRAFLPSIFLLVLLLPGGMHAQSTKADLRARLVNKPLFLRGQWVDDDLRFDERGKLTGDSKPVTFTLAAINVKDVKLSSDALTLRGERMGLEFNKDLPVRVPLHDITIKVARPKDGDYTSALNSIFAELWELAPHQPSYWQGYFAEHFPAPATMPDTSQSRPDLRRVGGAVLPPSVRKNVEPEFNDVARHLRYSGVTLVGLIVDETGHATKLRIVRPTGLGLDDRAVAAVSKYEFSPATENGNPIPVRVNVEVAFHID
jgi:TonB family protein